MPPKYVARDRAWGTRYDSLKPSSPPSSPPTQRLAPSTASSIPYSPSSPHGQDAPDAIMSTPTKSDKTSHDNSIFIGSLPSNMDHHELTRQLTDHLSDYPEIKSVKVVRDTKGGVCAFAQCESAPSAGRLLEILQTSLQRPFLGRYLRFELARAFRTLLVSYRTPPISAYPNSGLESIDVDSFHPGTAHRLPTAMRLYKPRNSKYCMAIYDSEACEFEAKHAGQTFDEVVEPNDPLSGAGLLISPLKFDAETLREIATAFGAVEHFGPFVPNAEGAKDAPNMHPHMCTRTAEMDPNTWEIKWEQREGCMNAAMTLRNVPHLTITWAHRAYPDTGSGWESRFGSPTVASSPRLASALRSRTQSRTHFPEFQRPGPPSVTSSMAGLRITSSSMTYLDHSPTSPQAKSLPYDSSTLRTPLSPLSRRVTMDPEASEATLVPDISDSEFPALHGRQDSQRLRKGALPALPRAYEETAGAGDDVFGPDPAMRASPTSSLSVQPSTPTPANTLRSPGPNASGSEYGYPGSPDDDDRADTRRTHDLTIPLTPDFTTASNTPLTPKTAFSFPHTPQSARNQAGYEHPGVEFGMFPRKDRRFVEREDGGEKEVDPLWVFAGSLDTAGPDPWHEERVRDVFGKHGEIEEVQFIQPMSASAAFAFIKYTNTTDSANAVAAENTRPYDGRSIRVQLRVMKPNRSARFARGKPRGQHDLSGFRGHINSMGLANDRLGGRFHPSNDAYYPVQSGGDPLQISPRAKASDDISQPVFPSIAAPEFKPPAINMVDSTRQTAVDEFSPERPVSSSSGSVSSPPSSSVGPPPMMAAYPMPPPAWSYPQYGYGSPYGYIGYHPTMGYHPGINAPNGDGSVAPHYAWSHQAYPYRIPYISPPASARSSAEQSSSQPPVKPFAFVTDQGTLVPMYPQDALSQYMSTNGTSTQSPPPTGTQTPAPVPPPMPGWAPRWDHLLLISNSPHLANTRGITPMGLQGITLFKRPRLTLPHPPAEALLLPTLPPRVRLRLLSRKGRVPSTLLGPDVIRDLKALDPTDITRKTLP
ncbi:hypothetical protein PHLGIDRAFT_115741 [Phlebiopsis gigantea 11061_1 CR5-6]|uniref:RRM domain-containing protein n=1 Tax=Phlebiopsis gigantea (strain 11061_1 CR5-6) TaxID=745531 RepID=A0A0C3S3H9_PHLG1|nr:hypothetical protein PHLGIDRAFT_115741 [Phlebiopsis gigantea 11061_1 CR5-6]